MTTITPAEMLANTEMCLRRANVALADARDWLASDWPAGTVLTDEQIRQRGRMHEAIGEAKATIERALGHG